jgi:acetyl-CoA acyltransferase
MNIRDVVIVAAARTPVGRAKKGGLATVRPDELAALVIKDLLERTPQLDPAEIEDVILGCAFPEGEQGLNMARTVALRAGLPESVCGETINRYCSSGSQAIAHAAYAIMSGQMEIAIAGGAESMSLVPMTGNKFAPNPYFAAVDPATYTSMGVTAENVAEKYGIGREAQDVFALRSHQRALVAISAHCFDPELVPVVVELVEPIGRRSIVISQDEGPRADTSLEALAKLKPAFREGGTVTAGNSSQTSDGAAAVIIMSADKAATLGIVPLARFVSFATGGVPAELMGIGPIVAVPKALKMAGLKLGDMDLIELNEAFASQSLVVIKDLGMDPEKVNVNGGAIALGHPLGCTGAKLTVQLIHEMSRRRSKYGLVTMCVGGGMGAATVFENLMV